MWITLKYYVIVDCVDNFPQVINRLSTVLKTLELNIQKAYEILSTLSTVPTITTTFYYLNIYKIQRLAKFNK